MRPKAAMLALLFAALPLAGGCASTSAPAAEAPSGCCKVCDTGKPCGDTCISKDKTCRAGDGCACGG